MPAKRFSTRKKVLLWGFLLTLFIGMVFITILSYSFPTNQGLVGLFVRFHLEAMLGMAMGGIVIGASSFYLLDRELKETKVSLQTNTQLILSLLAPEEKAFIQFLVDRKGEAFQSELGKLPGMNRLKAHRIVRRLADRKIIQVESFGKVNRVKLTPSIQEPNAQELKAD